jgi:Lrp/AsnC family leucine-responsive transcriptional regulator
MILDNFNKQIITELTKNSRISNVELAEKLCLSPAATYKRVKKLEASGLIKSYTTILDKQVLNLTTQIILYITLDGQDSKKLKSFENEIAKINNVVGCYLISGDYDYLVHIVVKDIPSYDFLYHQKISKLPHIKIVKSNFIVKEIMHSTNPVV